MADSIRDASAADLERVVAIYNEAIPGRLATADLEPVSVEARRAWFEAHRPERHPLLVAERGGRVAGWASLGPFYGRPAYAATAEISVYVARDFQCQGIGRALLDAVIARCPTLGISTLLGFIFAHNAPSLSLFAASGFHAWGRLPRVALLDGVERDLEIWGRSISL